MSDNINLLSTADFSPAMSSDEICFGEDVLLCLTDVVNGKANVGHSHSEYASSDHSHNEYAVLSDVEALQNAISNKADASHTHSGYALSSDLELLEDVVDTKANTTHTHSEYSTVNHSHDDEYSPLSHSHTGFATDNHNHDEDYASIDHVHDNYATQTALDEVSAAVSGKANTSHTHDDRYYTETEVDTKLATKADLSHAHTGVYDASGSAANALTEAKSYTDTKIDALVGEGASTTLDTIGEISSAIEENQDAIDLLNSAIANKANVVHTHAIADVANLQTALDAKASNLHTHTAADVGAAASNHSHNDIYYTETEVDSLLAAKSNSSHTHNYVPTSRTINGKALSSNITLSASDVGALSSDTDIPSALSDLTADSTHRLVTDAEKATWNAKSNFSGNYNDLTNKPTIPSISGLASETYVDEAVSAKADSSHTHAIADVAGLQSTLDGKAATSHGTHVSYSATAPVMDGTASVGTAATVARSDHKHPTDTSRASKTEFDTHASDATKHITSTERTNWGTAYTHSQATHAPSNAEKNQNAFSYVKVGTTSVAADTATDTLTLVAGTNVTITPDATGDSITISATDTNTTYSAGTGISLSGTTFNNSGVRSIATGASNGTISVNTNGTTTNVAVKGLGSAAYTASTAYDAAGTAKTKADAALVSAKAYADEIKDDLLNGAGTAYDTLKELGDLIDANVDAIDALEIVAASKANASDLTAHTSNKSNPHGVTLAQLGLTATAAELNKMDGITATTAELNILDGVTATTAELNYVDGVTSNIQTQLNGKASTSHTHNYAGSSSAGGAATSANKLNTNAGSATQPVYFANGVPVVCTYTLGKSVPSDAKFTDTTYSVATASANGLMSASDKSKLDAMVIATVSEVETYLGI